MNIRSVQRKMYFYYNTAANLYSYECYAKVKGESKHSTDDPHVDTNKL